jgi:penicillin-binding protein 1C
VDFFVQTMSELGFTGLERADFYGPSLALGSANVRLLELTNAYRSLARGGVWSPLRFSPDKLSDQAPRRVLSPGSAFIAGDILAQNKIDPSPGWTALETAGDGWCVGYSEKYTVGVWTEERTQAAPVWQEIINGLHHSEKSHAPENPEELVQRPVALQGPARLEWFLPGTEPVLPGKRGAKEIASRITYPVDQSAIELDADILKFGRRMFIQIVSPRIDQNLYLNGRRLGRAKPFLPWEPHAGKYMLELRDSRGQVVDKVRFEVRGRSFASTKVPGPLSWTRDFI